MSGADRTLYREGQGPVHGGGGGGGGKAGPGHCKGGQSHSAVQGALLWSDRQTRLKTLPSPLRWKAVTMGLLGRLTLFEEDCCGSLVMRIHGMTATPTYIETSLILKLWRDNGMKLWMSGKILTCGTNDRFLPKAAMYQMTILHVQ